MAVQEGANAKAFHSGRASQSGVYAALLALKTGRPVKVMTTSEEELTAAYPRQGTRIELKTGVTRDGRITAKSGRIWFDTGAFVSAVMAASSRPSVSFSSRRSTMISSMP